MIQETKKVLKVVRRMRDQFKNNFLNILQIILDFVGFGGGRREKGGEMSDRIGIDLDGFK